MGSADLFKQMVEEDGNRFASLASSAVSAPNMATSNTSNTAVASDLNRTITGAKLSHLLALPRELRDAILEYILVKPTNTITMLPNFTYHKNEISACPPSVCSVNHQLRAETLPTFYGANVFTAQLDNDQDLATAKAWLCAIGDDNVGNLKQVILCGWTRVPFGHMVSRRWIRLMLDLKKGSIELVKDKDAKHVMEHPETTRDVEELGTSFKNLIESRRGEPMNIDCLAQLMDGFNLMCTGY